MLLKDGEPALESEFAGVRPSMSPDRRQTRGRHTFCHSFAAHLLESGYDIPGYDIRTIQELLGHGA